MSDEFNQPQPGSFPAPGQPSFPTPSTPPNAGPPPPPYGAPTEPMYSVPGGRPPDFSSGPPAPIVANQAPPRRSRGKMLGAVAGVAAVLAAGTFAFTQLRSNDNDGGAASPEELGEQLVAALNDEDILGAVDLLLPGERETFRQPLVDLVGELTRLQVTDDSADLDKVGGLDITILDPRVDVEATNVDDVAKVSIAATSSVTIDGRDLPIGDFLIETAFGGERPDINEDSGEQDFDISFASVENDGRWYVSLFYTAADTLRGDQDIPEEGVTAVGASSPEGALDNLVNYTSNLELENIIASLNPNEASALQRYAPLFLDDAQAALDDVEIVWTISDTEYSVTGSGDTRQVFIDSFRFEAQVDGETVEFDWKDGCLVGTTPQGEFDSCTALDQANSALDDYLDLFGVDDSAPLKQLLTDVGDAFRDFSPAGVVVDRVGGSWYVSPIGTGSESLLSVLRALDRDEIETVINDVQNVFDAAIGDFDMPGIGFPTDTTLPTESTVPTDTAAPSDTVPTDDSVTNSTVIGTGLVENWYDCLDQFQTQDDVTGCIENGIGSGKVDVEDVPGPFLFAECGLYDYYASDALYTDDAATFLATIEPGRQCIIDAAAAAGIDVLFSSPEFVRPECFTMDNPWNFDEPGEVDGYECAFAAG